jgi:hypothetical protein
MIYEMVHIIELRVRSLLDELTFDSIRFTLSQNLKVIMKSVFTSFLVLFLLAFPNTTKSQENIGILNDFHIVFEDMQHGFESGGVAVFSAHFASQVQVTLKGAESGYYSANHMYYILENFLKTRKVVSFEFTNVSETEATPYATGTAVFSNRGNREVAQVYVALMKLAEKWVIAEINIY